MIIIESKSTIVTPVQLIPQKNIWITSLDQLVLRTHTLTVYFYKSNGTTDFFGIEILKDALSKTLVPFYPMAGRLTRTEDGLIEIVCNNKGVLFVEAITDSTIDDFGDFTPRPELEQLIPKINYSDDITCYPLLLLQVTRFKCGGICLGFGIHHTLADGASALNFVNSFAQMARGEEITLLPSFDRSPLRARDPPSPAFPHIECKTPPAMKTMQSNNHSPVNCCIFQISRDQLDQLKAKVKEGGGEMASYTTQEILAAHLWRCVCEARALPNDQESMLYVMCDVRSRLRPPLPNGYFGNAILSAAPVALAGKLQSMPLHNIAGKIHDAIVRVDDEYLRSALDFLHMQPDLTQFVRGPRNFCSPNMAISSWFRFPLYDADFGWGRPVHMGPARIYYEGIIYILASPVGGGGLQLAISLQSEHMFVFKKLLYDFS